MQRLLQRFSGGTVGLAALALVAATLCFPSAGEEPEEPSVVPAVALPAPSRSRQLELAADEADVHTRRAFQLAERGAYFSAHAELINALRLVAQGLDAEDQTLVHSKALAAGLRAMKEADDFVPAPGQLEADLDLPVLVRTHRTPVLKATSLDRLTAVVARQSYLTFAQEQLAISAGSETSGSMALYGLGKLYAAMAREPGSLVRQPIAKAVAFHQAALLVDPTNYMASNELGVLFARSRRYEEARAALEHSVTMRSTPTGWHNLATVYRALGLAQRAERAERLARREAASTGQPAGETSVGIVRWVPPETFGGGRSVPATSPLATGASPPASQPPKAKRDENGTSRARVASKSFWSSLLGSH